MAVNPKKNSINGKHVIIKRPCSVAVYFNYKNIFSIILLAVVGADYYFTHIDVGGNDQASDSAIFRDSTLNIVMESNPLEMPEFTVIIGDDVLPSKTNRVKPYSENGISDVEIIINYLLYRARRVVENAFGILI